MTAYEIRLSLVGSEMCIRDRHDSEVETWEKGFLWCERDTASIFSVPIHLDEAEEYK